MTNLIKIIAYIKPKLLILLILATVLLLAVELLGVLSLSYFIDYLINTNNNIINLDNYFEKFNIEKSLLSVSILVIASAILRNFYFGIYIYIKAKYSHSISEVISNKILSFFLRDNVFLKNKYNPSYLQHLTVNQSFEVSASTVMGIIEVLSSTLIIVGICLFLFSINSLLFISITLGISILYILIYLFFNSFIKKLSTEKFSSTKIITKTSLEIYENLKEIKLLNLKNYFKSKFENDYKIFNKYRIWSKIITRYPRLIVESFVILTIVIILNYSVKSSIGNLISIASIFVVGFYRILPYADNIFTAWTNFKISKDLLDFLKKNKFLEKKPLNKEEKKEKVHKFILLEIKKAYYKIEKKIIFNNFNLTIKNKDKLFISGKSGSGKTSLINIICGLYKFDKGQYNINSKNIKSISNIYSIFSTCSQNPILLNRSIRENIILNKDFDEEKFKKILKIVELNKLINKGKTYNTKINPDSSNFSGGEKQRISIARTLYHLKDVLIMDEATNGLDSKSEMKIIQNILSTYKSKTIIFISHNKDLKKLFNRNIDLI